MISIITGRLHARSQKLPVETVFVFGIDAPMSEFTYALNI
jgi:hypothetical protein